MHQSGELVSRDNNIRPEMLEIFSSLVMNAIDFFRHSIVEFEEYPKYSVIHFFAAIELFFKARLLLEHWSLIVDDPKKANYHKFLMGDFSSVGLDEAINRLTGISGESFDKQEREVFANLRAHRNRLTHFYYDRYMKNDQNTIEQIAIEQSKGWYQLYRLLTTTWQSEFKSFSSDFQELQTLMKKQKEYLAARFEHLQPAIKEEKLRGITYLLCPSCGYVSGRLASEDIGPVSVTCQVCEHQFDVLFTICPHCDVKTIYDSSVTCSNCHELIHTAELIFHFRTVTDKWAYCDDCKFDFLPSIGFLNDQWICLSCMNNYENRDIYRCGWCGEYVTGDIVDYYPPHCFMCAIHTEEETTGISDRFQREDRGHER